jgi:hypothetical protein
MVSEPTSMTDLSRALVDTPRDLIQAVLDLLRVMGLVVLLRPLQPLSSRGDRDRDKDKEGVPAASAAGLESSSPVASVTNSVGGSVPTANPAGVSSQGSMANNGGGGGGNMYFTMAEFAKVPNAIDLGSVEEDVDRKIAEKEATEARNKALNELTSKSLTKEERMSALKELLIFFFCEQPSLRDDPLYSVFADNLEI